jgi:general secretion pathway protein K
MTTPRSHRGAALLSAMLTVALVATFAAAALWQQWRSIEVEAAERARVQSDWVLTGALDWARLILREDSRSAGGADHLGEPWAVPLEEARLSSFLAADSNNNSSDTTGEVLDAFMSGHITDLQSLLNVNNLVTPEGKLSEPDLERFARLFDQLALPLPQLDTLAENLRFASDKSPENRSSPLAPLPPQRIEQLVWLGLPESTLAALKPYVTLLPANPSTKVNLNTASAEVISAAIKGLSLADAQRLVAVRQRQPFTTVEAAGKAINADTQLISDMNAGGGISTSFFEVRSRLRLDKLIVEERAVVKRNGVLVTVLQRERVTPEATTGTADATKR